MMFFMSGEIDADLGPDEHIARNSIKPVIRKLMHHLSFDSNILEWSFISVILSDQFITHYPEVAKLNKRNRTMEFRLHISHQEFKVAAPKKQISMILDTIERSISLMEQMEISETDRQKFASILNSAKNALL
ncbi:Imm44 family immunity protein [Pseudomonas urmiensis]|jgi:rRNA maturation endonuclease Nob1|uniref:Uncharacterized protein n=1 Tax=Pseudomonas urmiensis TaxID=2745493 RepID=A0A923G1C1_9PSED|nr:Imm44 family immunity protein [Pseudomonas urmiensis]MBV4536789.1 hypothetical protein [Pseudomonas urmiensis]